MRDIMSLSKVLITGSSNGLGNYLAIYFSQKGHELLLHGRDESKLIETQKLIFKEGIKANYVVADLTKDEDIKNLCNQAKKEKVKILINNAGIICPNTPFEIYTYEKIDAMIKANLIAPIKIINSLIGILDNIVNINSMVGLESKKNRTLYSATKWGLRGFSESLKKENLKEKILDVYPTNIKTWPERENAMEVEFVINKIYKAMQSGKSELILDGRK
tara:strand:- start:24663 stop:25316 length:654 start_codon:yes stop_codon:yes gene_type:complete